MVLMMKWFLFMMLVASSLMVIVSTARLVKRESGQLLNNYSGHLEKRPFCNAFTGCGKKRSFGSTSSQAASSSLDDQSAALSSSSDEPMDSNEWLQYMRLTQKIMDEARSWELLQTKVNQFGPIELARRQRPFDLTA